MKAALLFVVLFSLHHGAWGKGVYQTGPEFIAEVFGDTAPKADYLLLTPARKEAASQIMKRKVRGLRTRFWHVGNTSVWIMEEIGKELPITIGVVVNDNHIQQVKILAFRESRGWEVRYPAFTAQYAGVKMTDDLLLDTHIDGITGATLSVRAVTKVAALALYYHQQAFQKPE